MNLPQQYDPKTMEPAIQEWWHEKGVYHFHPDNAAPVYSIDTPPATVSGKLHLGHVYSYSHADFMARFFRMQGYSVYYPMGFDDNGLPTERLVEKQEKVRSLSIGRQEFTQLCLKVSRDAEKEYEELWQRLGLSIDWRYTYRTIDDRCRRISQKSFLDLYQKGLVDRREAPAIWCPTCATAIAQAELDDLPRTTEFITLDFGFPQGGSLPIATTRPELLCACVAVFIHPDDARYTPYLGKEVIVPYYQQRVPILADVGVDRTKGTGAVMCCTFGDQADVGWWNQYHLPLINAFEKNGRMNAVSGALEGMRIPEARSKMKELLAEQGLIQGTQPLEQTVRVHERCDTPVEYIVTPQWFIRVLQNKQTFLALGEQLNWHPEHMKSRYTGWVENLNWDWCISRQRYFGVPFPLWYCSACGKVILAREEDLPVDPILQKPYKPCTCGCNDFIPEIDVMDTWATSSMTPQIVSHWQDDPQFFTHMFPNTLRPQAHEIIRTWAFYSIVKSYYHFGKLPWSDVLISGWGLAGEGMGKISKSRGGGPFGPMLMIQRYSADAARYWAASTGPGRDAVISEDKIKMGMKLVTKLWNVARFSQGFLLYGQSEPPADLTPTDRWICSRMERTNQIVTSAMQQYEYATAKSEIESFFWKDLADNYLEMAKQRLYNPDLPGNLASRYVLTHLLLTVVKLFAPFLPYITEAIYRELFAQDEGTISVHLSRYPQNNPFWLDLQAEKDGDLLVDIATTVRRFKSERNLNLGMALSRLQLKVVDRHIREACSASMLDLSSVTRAEQIEIVEQFHPESILLKDDETIAIAVLLHTGV